ncbi:MAG: NAD(P)/FAD-dependent oxidoreductase [Gammaproteobacteria bacterium]|nr:NAD(P)/FAD-dependent oxidoreductase [Gammaproteobacteria bacterium]
MRFDVIVIGAGAAGMMCAAQAGGRGRRVLLIDHVGKIGERIRISGGGRCNFTNRNVGPENFLSQNPHFCRSALARYSQSDFIALVERYRIAYHEREHGQMFCDDSAQAIIDMLKAECDAGGVQWMFPCAVQGIEPAAGDSDMRYTLATDRGDFLCRSLVIACGGLAVPKLGASPFGYKVAEQFGLRVVPPKPALVPLALAPETLTPLKPLSGVAFDAVTRCDSTQFHENVLITHRGLSGPAILQISSYWQMQEYGDMRDGKKQPIAIDLLPGIDAAAWLEEHRSSKALLHNLLAERLPRRFAQEWCALLGWEKPLNEYSRRDLNSIAQALKAWALLPSGTLGYAKAEVTLGGVDTHALSSKTMEAKAAPGLYFIGEVVDVTGWLGGYNFQWAWSSGWVAGQFV